MTNPVRAFRRAHNLTPLELANHLAISERTVFRWEAQALVGMRVQRALDGLAARFKGGELILDRAARLDPL